MKRNSGVGGVTEMEYRRALEETRRKSSLDSAALQADLARRLKLPGTSNGAIVQRQQRRPPHREDVAKEAADAEAKESGRNRSSSSGSSSSGSSSSSKQVAQPPTRMACASCGAINFSNDSICRSETCGYYLAGVRQPALTLAQRRGLVQAPPKTESISAHAWAIIEARVDDRKDAFCPICMDAFKSGHEVLLSCSHMFHRQCLAALEQFMGSNKETLSCPICRSTNYQKKITKKGSQAFECICAAKLQAVWKGYAARTAFHTNLRTFYRGRGRGVRGAGGGDGTSMKSGSGSAGAGTGAGAGSATVPSRQRRRFFERELSIYADKLTKEAEARGGIVDRSVIFLLCAQPYPKPFYIIYICIFKFQSTHSHSHSLTHHTHYSYPTFSTGQRPRQFRRDAADKPTARRRV